jgi:TolB-like protein/DNA-binding winged helix-turn-helix (wHTH) protein/tetratricopeptide (TPR) repeat protein
MELMPGRFATNPLARARLLGGFHLWTLKGDPVPLASRRARSLLAVVCLEGGAGVPRERLCGLLWSDRAEDQARASLRQCLFELKAALGDLSDGLLDIGRERIVARSGALDSDIMQAQRALEGSDPAELAAVGPLLSTGQLLEGLGVPGLFQDWLKQTRSAFEATLAADLGRCLVRLEKEARWGEVIALADAYLRRDPLHEGLVAAAIRAERASGRNAAAQKRLLAITQLLSKELGVTPSSSVIEAANGEPAAPAPKASAAAATESQQSAAAAADGPQHARPRIGVLPFSHPGGDPDQANFAEALAEDLISGLAQSPLLAVTPRQSSFSYEPSAQAVQKVCAELGVDYVVRGTVRKLGRTLRVATELVRGADGTTVWSARYDRSIDDLFAVLESILVPVFEPNGGEISRGAEDGSLRFEGVLFHEDFASATTSERVDLRFTRMERAALTLLAANPKRLFTRDELLTAIGSGGSDRNVDVVINRLRRKLGDTDPERRFISTQYGEGYIWVAEPIEAAEAIPLLVLGPVRGLTDELLELVLQPLREALRRRIAQAQDVPLALVSTPDTPVSAHFSVDATFHRVGGQTHAAFTLRREPSHEAVASFRSTFKKVLPSGGFDDLAAAIVAAMWKILALGPQGAVAPTDPPLYLRMHNAASFLDPPGVNWLSNGQQIAYLRAENPSDPVPALMWAMHSFAQSIVAPGLEPIERSAVAALEDEIEGIVLEHVSAVRHDPILALAAAKLLLLVNRGHEDLAETLATRAFSESAAFAAAFPVLGQIQAYRGDLAEACRLYDEGLRLCDLGSTFEAYILVIKAMALIALDDRAGVEEVFTRIVEIEPASRERFGLFFLPPDDLGLGLRLAPLADRADIDQARRAIAYLHFRVADLFRNPAHAANLMRGPLTHLVRRLGPGVASDQIWSELPEELHHLRVRYIGDNLP